MTCPASLDSAERTYVGPPAQPLSSSDNVPTSTAASQSDKAPQVREPAADREHSITPVLPKLFMFNKSTNKWSQIPVFSRKIYLPTFLLVQLDPLLQA
jgi:hypothetical protein